MININDSIAMKDKFDDIIKRAKKSGYSTSADVEAAGLLIKQIEFNNEKDEKLRKQHTFLKSLLGKKGNPFAKVDNDYFTKLLSNVRKNREKQHFHKTHED